jgi:hypothetical protein|tara:strand:+ start:10 stop:2115 length:2106 start_codon:yes stop_codon:yes gene_type:complete
MSAQNPRTRKPPDRLVPVIQVKKKPKKKALAVKTVAGKKSVKGAKKTKTESSPKSGASKNQIKNDPILKSVEKFRTLNAIEKLRSQKAPNPTTNNHAAYQLLSSMYRNHPSSQLEKYLPQINNMNNSGQTQFNKFVIKQHNVLTKNSSKLHVLNDTAQIDMDDTKMHDLLLMLFIDMKHDELFNQNSFQAFLDSDIVDMLIDTDKVFSPIETPLVKRLMEHDSIVNIKKDGDIVTTGKGGLSVEKKLVTNLPKIWNTETKILRKSTNIKPLIKNKSKPIYVSYDAENASYISDILAGSRMNDGTYYLKRTFTLANLMDPGRGSSKNTGGTGKSGGSIDQVFSRLFDAEDQRTPFKFNYQRFNFNFGKYMKVNIIQDGYKFNATLNGRKMNLQIKNADAQKSKKPMDKLSKTFGDFLQIMTVAHMRNNSVNIVSSTHDGAFVGMTAFVQRELFGLKPAIIVDATTLYGSGLDRGIYFYGLSGYLTYNMQPTRSRVTSQIQGTGSASKSPASITKRGINPKSSPSIKVNASMNKTKIKTPGSEQVGNSNTRSPMRPLIRKNSPQTSNAGSAVRNSPGSSRMRVVNNGNSNNNNNVTGPIRKSGEVSRVSPKRPTPTKNPTATRKRGRNNNQDNKLPQAKQMRRLRLPPKTAKLPVVPEGGGMSRGLNNTPATRTRSAVRSVRRPGSATPVSVRRTPGTVRTPK